MCHKCGTDDETYNPKTDSCNSCMPNLKPHKHAALIKAWADGAQIQVRDVTNYFDAKSCHWKDFSKFDDEVWYNEWEYRIKPQTIKFRNALLSGYKKDNYVIACNINPESVEQNPMFIKWLGDWQEVEI